MHYLEHYLDAMASIEATAVKLNIPVRIEGYEPPRDNRLEKLVVSPDPGVIEVNVHPAKSWEALCNNTNLLYEEAAWPDWVLKNLCSMAGIPVRVAVTI